jgi:hypothetical protein
VQVGRAPFPSLTFGMKEVIISKYSSDSLTANSLESIERVFPLEVRGVISRRFKIGNAAGEYTKCSSSPQYRYVEKDGTFY